jgi:hypothetical protein
MVEAKKPLQVQRPTEPVPLSDDATKPSPQFDSRGNRRVMTGWP